MTLDPSRRPKCTSLGRVTAKALLSFLSLTPHVAGAWTFDGQTPLLPHLQPLGSNSASTSPPSPDDTFTLRHVVHRGGSLHPNLHRRLDVNPDRVKAALRGELDEEDGIGPYTARSSSVHIPRLHERSVKDLAPMIFAAQAYGETVTFPDEAWTLDEVPSPNVTDWDTVINFSLMTGSAYNRDDTDPEWEDVRPPFNLSSDVGWEQDGIRGHVFVNKDNSTIVLAIKGTSSAVFDGTETTTNDKENDNLFAGCCCGQGEHYLWRKVCDCMTSQYACNETCVVKHMRAPDRYYAAAIELYGNVTEMYPDSVVWLTGHSLGGLVTGLLGLTFGLPVVTFEAVPQALAAGRLGLPVPPGYRSVVESRMRAGLWNFGHTADPVFMGACNSLSSLCTIAGYALQSQCHVGMRCVYDTVNEWKWRMSLTTHGIRSCIEDVYRAWDDVPSCVPDDECEDCYNWKRYKSNGSEVTTTRTSTTTTAHSTRTETCQTPGWWGCLDSSTTSSGSSITSRTTITTETCLSRGWFGNCLDESTTTFTSTTTMPAPTTTSASETDCETPGWFGCKDSTTTTSTTTSTSKHPSSTTAPSSSSIDCETPGLFWGCKDQSSTSTSVAGHAITEAPWHDMVL